MSVLVFADNVFPKKNNPAQNETLVAWERREWLTGTAVDDVGEFDVPEAQTGSSSNDILIGWVLGVDGDSPTAGKRLKENQSSLYVLYKFNRE